MTTKPGMQSLTGIDYELTGPDYITFWAAPDVAKEFAQFGSFHKLADSDRYTLYVDGRFDFDEVLAYIKNYC